MDETKRKHIGLEVPFMRIYQRGHRLMGCRVVPLRFVTWFVTPFGASD